MSLYLLDDTLSIDVFYEKNDSQFCDNICIRFWESCPDEEKLFVAGETNIYITPEQACQLAEMLMKAVKTSQEDCAGMKK